MSNITIGRYDHESVTQDYAGWLEGDSEHGKSWIIFLDENGTPALFWPERDDNGGVVGDPIRLN